MEIVQKTIAEVLKETFPYAEFNVEEVAASIVERTNLAATRTIIHREAALQEALTSVMAYYNGVVHNAWDENESLREKLRTANLVIAQKRPSAPPVGTHPDLVDATRDETKTISILFMKGVEGNSFYLNDTRIAGPKPWGAHHDRQEKFCSLDDLANALRGIATLTPVDSGPPVGTQE
jgi:hypothetical protein